MSAEVGTPNAAQSGMVRVLISAIVIMTLAIALIMGLILGRILSPGAEGPQPTSAVDFAAAPQTSIVLPSGERVAETAVSAERVTLRVTTASGETAIYTAPLTGFDGPVRLVVESAE